MEKKENELLLEISKAISTIRRKEDLLQVILEKIKPQLGFYDSGILLLDKEKEHFFDLSVLHPEIDNSQINHSLHQGSYYQIIKMPLKGSTVEHTIRQLSKKRELVVFDFEADYSTYTDAKLMVDIKRQGIKEGLAALLQTGGEVLGVFFINSLQKDFFQPRQFSFFQVIAELVAVAVANILANEEILEREREKTMLLSLSEDMATIRDREDLWRVIVEKTRPLVNFNDAVIIQLSLDGHQYKHLLTASTLERKRTDLYQQLVGPFLPLKNTSVAYLLQLPDATVWHTEELLKCYPNDAGLHLCQQTGLHHGVVLHLIWAGQLIGLLQLAFNQQDQIQSSKLPFYKAIADQVAVAVANILANEEILRRESEKETLLTVSEDIATIRDKEDLFRIVTGKLQPLFGFQDAVISLLYPEQNQIVHLLTISPPERQAHSLYQKIVRQTQPLLGSGYEYTMSLPEGGQFKTKDLLEQYPQADGLKLMLETDLHYSAFIPLRNMGNRLGQLNLHYHQEPNALNFRLLRNLADQIAVGVANILANEEILQREREKSVLLSISESIASARNAVELLSVIREKAQQLIPFHDTGILIVEPDGHHHYDLAVNIPGWDPSESNKQLYQAELKRIYHPGSYIDHVMRLLWDKNCPIIEDYQKRYGEFDYPFFPIIKQLGYKEGLTTELRSGGKVLGTLWLNSLQENHFHPQQFEIFQALADQVAVAIANILANEEILQREREKTLLLKVSKAIAKIDNKVDLLHSIDELLVPIFHHSDAGVLLADRDKQYVVDYHALYADVIPATPLAQAMNAIAQEQGFIRMPLPGSLVEWAMGQPPMLGKLADLLDSGYDAPYLSYEMANGLTHYLCAPLTVSGNTFGFFDLLFKEAHQPDASRLPLFAQIADVIAVALSNILANEEILEREREKSQLLEITELIAQVKATDDLLRLIVDKIKPLFGFHDCGLFVVSPDGKTHSDLAAVLPDVSPSEWNAAIAAVSAHITHRGSAAEWMMNELEVVGGPVLFDFKELVERFPDYPQLDGTGMLDMGYRDCLAATLVVRGKAMGMFCINALKKDFFSPAIFPLFQSVTHTIAIAVANILANEEILEREREKATLLSISQALNQIKNRKDLIKVIYGHIRQVFDFDDTGLFLINGKENYHKLLVEADMVGVPQDWQGTTERIPHRGSVVEWCTAGYGISALEDMPFFSQHPHYPVVVEGGFKEFIYGPLRYGGQIIGMLCFQVRQLGFYTAKDLHLFENIANQLAVAVANILANEEILQREREKSLLLSMSEDMATIRAREDLWRVMMEKIKPLVGYDDAVLLFLSEDLTKYSLLTMSSTERQAHALYSRVVGNNQVANSPVPWYLKQPTDLFVQDLQTLEADPTFPSDDPAVRMMKETGLWCSVVQKLRWSGRLMGLILFHFGRLCQIQTHKYDLYKGIADQVAVAVANILANEEIMEREREKSLQITLTDALTRQTSWEHKLLKMVEALLPFIPFDYVAVGIEKNGKQSHGYSYRRIGLDEYQTIGMEDFLRMSGLTLEKYTKLRAELSYTAPLILTGKSFEAYCSRSSLKRLLAGMFNLQSNLLLPLPLSRDGQFILSLFSRHPDTYNKEHLQFLTRLESSLTLTLDRLLAYEEIKKLSERLKEENTYLLEEVKTNYNFEEIIGNSPSIREVLNKVIQVAPVEATVLIGGETGTGKELIARAIHNMSARRNKLLVKINCACLPAQLIESELFGHERGAFTGALDRRIGKFELASGGTIFLDEIGEMPLELQAKLLRVIQEREIERLGGKGPIKTDVRIIAATNRNLQQEVAQGKFRADLYFRLNVFPITLPPLRDRKEDIPLLATHFLKKTCKKMGKTITSITHEALKQMMVYQWPGNIRELEHVMEHSVITSTGKALELARPLNTHESPVFALDNSENSVLKTLADNERNYILKVLKLTNGRIRGVGGAAEILDIFPTTLEGRMKKLGIKKQHVVKV